MPNTLDQYVQSNLPLAQEVQKKFGIPVLATLAQGSVESANGNSVVGNNYFGIKSTTGTGVHTTDAQTGEDIIQEGYKDAAESHDKYGHFLTTNDRYKPAFAHTNDPKAFITEVANAGYAGDNKEQYAKVVNGRMDDISKILDKKQPNTGYAPLPDNTKQSLIALNVDPVKYAENVNAAIEKGGDDSYKAYKSLYATYDRTATPEQYAQNAFQTATTNGLPVVKTVLHSGDDFRSAVSNSFTDLFAFAKEAGAGIEHKLGITDEAQFKAQTQDILKQKAYDRLRISENGQKDPFSRLPDGSINWNGLAAGTGGLVGGMLTLVPAIVGGALVTAATGGGDLPFVAAGAAVGAEGAAVGAAETGVLASLTYGDLAAMTGTSITMATQGYGSHYEEGLQRGLDNDSAATYGSIGALTGGIVGLIPGGAISKKLFGVAAKELSEPLIKQAIDAGGKITPEMLNDFMPELTDGLKALAKRRLAATGKAVLEEGGIVGGVMGTQEALDRIGTIQYAQLANQQDKFRDILDKTAEENFVDVLKSTVQGVGIGAIFGLGTAFKSAAHPTMYGYVEENAAKPEKLDKLKAMIADYGEKTGKQDLAQKLSGDVDDMAHVATTYGKLVKDPNARYQIFQLGDESKKAATGSEYANEQKLALEKPGIDPEIVEKDKAKWDKVIELNGEKQKLITAFKKQIGDTKKPIDYNDYVTKSKAIDEQIKSTINSTENAEEVRSNQGQVHPTGGQQENVSNESGENIQQPAKAGTETGGAKKQIDDLAQRISKGEKITSPEDLQLQAQYPKELETALAQIKGEEDLDKLFNSKKAVAPKTVNVIGVPIKIGNTSGFLAVNGGNLEFTTGTGKTSVLGKASDYLSRPFAELGIQPEDVDQYQLKQKMQADQETAKKEAEKKALAPVPLETLNGKPVVYKGKKGILTLDEGGKTSFEAENGKVYDISTEQNNRNARDYGIEPVKEKPAEPKYEVSGVSETEATVNGQKYNIQTDEKGNISGLSPVDKPEQVLKNEKLLAAVESERNKSDYQAGESATKQQVDDIAALLPSTEQEADGLITNIQTAHMNEPIAQAIDALYDGQKITAKQQAGIQYWGQLVKADLLKLQAEEKYAGSEQIKQAIADVDFITQTAKENVEPTTDTGATGGEHGTETAPATLEEKPENTGIAETDKPDVQPLGETPPRGEGETKQVTAAEGDKGGAENKGTESTEPVKEDNGHEVGKTVTFEHGDGSEITGTVKSVDSKGNLKVKGKDGLNYTIKPEQVKEPAEEPTTITIKSEDSKRTVEVKIKKKAKEANAKAEEKGISLKEQKDDLVNKMQTAVSVIGDAEEITPEIEKELAGHGIKIIKSDVRIADLEVRKDKVQKQMDAANEELQAATDNYNKKYKKTMKHDTEWALKYPMIKARDAVKEYQNRIDNIDAQIRNEQAGRVTDQLGFHIKGDGDVRAGIENLKETLEMTKKEFPEKEGGETKVKYEKGKGITGPHKLTEADALHGTTPREQYEIAKENYETAKAGGDKKFIEILKKAFDSAKQDFDKYEKEGSLDKNWLEIHKAEGRYQRTGGKPIEKSTVNLIDRTLKKAFPNIKTNFLTGEEFEAKHGTDALGVVNKDGTVDINTDKVTGQTQVHEMGHIWTSWAKKFAPDLYKRGMELAQQETGIHDAIKADGYDLNGQALHEETLARMIGEKGEALVKDLKEPTTLSEKAKAWISEMWDKLKDYVKNRLGIKDTRFDNLKDMPFNQFAGEIARHLVAGKEISTISSEDIAGIEKDGVSAYGIGDSKRYMKTFEMAPGERSVPISSIPVVQDPEKPLTERQKNDQRIEGKLITEVSETGATVSDNPNRDIVNTNKLFVPFHQKLLSSVPNNKYAKMAFRQVQKTMLEISSPGTWAYAIDGANGMFWKAYEALNHGDALAFRYKTDNQSLIKPLIDFANEGMKKTLADSKGENLKTLFPGNTTVPDAKITHAEQVELHGLMQQEDYQRLLDAGKGITILLEDDFPNERKKTKFVVTKADFAALEKQFTPEQIKLMNDARNATADAMHKQENPAHKALTGEDIEKFDNYQSVSNVAGMEDNISDYKLKNTYVENVAGHKERSGSTKAVYLIGNPEKSWERRIDQGSKYAGLAIPIRNTDVLMDYARQNMVDLEMNHYIEYWNKKKQVLTNPEPPVGKVERFIVNNFITATIGFNPFVDLKHLTTFPLASGYVPLKYTMASLGDVAESYVSLVKNLDPLNTGKPKNYTPLLQECLKDNFFYLRYKSGVDESQIRLKGDKFSVPMYKEGKWQMVDFADKSTAVVFLKTLETATGTGLWSGAKKQVRAEFPHLAEGSPEFTKMVSDKYRDGITASQPSFNGINRPLFMDGGFEKTRGVLNKALSLFAGQPFAAFNETIKRGMGMLADPTPKSRFAFGKSVTNTIVVNALIVAAINLARQKTVGSDKDKETFSGMTLRAGLGSLPILGPVLETVYGKVEKGQQGYDLSYPALEVVNDGAKTIAHAVTGHEEQAAKEFMRIGPQLLGVPAQPFKIGKAAYDEVSQ